MKNEPARQIAPDGGLQTARWLYQAFAAHDATALLALLARGFRGVVCEGVPQGLGGAYDGAETMLRDCWARVFALLDVRPVPAEYLPVADDRIRPIQGRRPRHRNARHKPRLLQTASRPGQAQWPDPR